MSPKPFPFQGERVLQPLPNHHLLKAPGPSWWFPLDSLQFVGDCLALWAPNRTQHPDVVSHVSDGEDHSPPVTAGLRWRV